MTSANDPAVTRLRLLPQVERLSSALEGRAPHPARVEAARRAIADASDSIRQGNDAPTFEELIQYAQQLLGDRQRARLSPVVNATGVLLHTNLGRAPLSDRALQAIEQVGAGYSNLEFDLARGRRGSRYAHSAAMLTTLTGAQSALVVNNNAGAVLLSLAGLCAGREVIVSRGELIEIGGEFRIPEIMASSGAIMREVGTTNRTHLADYAGAVSEATAAILKVHPSNYEVTGFTAAVPSADLARLAARHGIAFINDVGSGLLSHGIGGQSPPWLRGEPSVTQAVREGADLVTFSGDKLLGGPQSGILAGTAAAIDRLRKLPLLRTLRTDKTTLAALDATLAAYLDGEPEQLPLWRMALAPAGSVRARAEKQAVALSGSPATVAIVDGFSTTGGGSAPGSRIPTALLRLDSAGATAQAIYERLLDHDPAVVARIEDGALVLDLRTVAPEDDALVGAALAKALQE